MRYLSQRKQTLVFVWLLFFSTVLATGIYRLDNVSVVALRSGESLFRQGRIEEAAQAFREAAAGHQLRSSLALALARGAFAVGDAKTGEAVLTKLSTSKTRLSPDTLNAVAGLLDSHGLPDQALMTLGSRGSAILESEPAAVYLAELTGRAGKSAEAEHLYRDILARYPDSPSARIGLAQLLLGGGRVAEAATLCQDVLERTPDNRRARIVLGRALTAEGKFEDAIVQYRKALERTP